MSLLPLRSRLDQLWPNLILASSSPRRQQLMKQMGLSFTVHVSSFAEDLDKKQHTPASYVIATSRHKAIDVAQHMNTPVDIVIGADTVVVCDDTILEKPSSYDDAIRMLTMLSGRCHYVYTGCTLILNTESISSDSSIITSYINTLCNHMSSMKSTYGTCDIDHIDRWIIVTFSERTTVEFAKLSLETIKAYVDTKEPMDKAGGYGYQSLGAVLARRIDGCYYNVVGFPLHHVEERLGTMIHAYDEIAKTSTSTSATT